MAERGKLLELCKTRRLSGDYSCINYLFQLCLFPILSLNEFSEFCHKYSGVSIKIRMSIYGHGLRTYIFNKAGPGVCIHFNN